MRHEPLSLLRQKAEIEDVSPRATRERRLRRWAELLAADGDRPLRALMAVELYAESVRRTLRRDGSPISVAFADPGFRAEGLEGDTLGHAQAFFHLSDREAHEALCDCHAPGRLTGREASRRIQAIARPSLWRRVTSFLAR